MSSPHARLLTVVVAIATLCGVATPAVAGPKTDIVQLKNGDRITCEIKNLDRGKLTVKTDGIGTISIEWDDIDWLTSPTSFEIEFESGVRAFGSLARSTPGMLDIVSTGVTESLSLPTIVSMSPLGGTFWSRLDGSIDAGFSFTQANVQTQWTFHSTVTHHTQAWTTELSGDSSLTSNEDSPRQTRNEATLQTERFLWPRLSAIGFAQFQQNEELALNLRAVMGGGLNRTLTRSNRTILSGVVGVAFTKEDYTGDDDQNIAEAIGGVVWEFFTFDGRSTNLKTSTLTYFALNGDARMRLELNTSFKSDIVGDLYWSIDLFESLNTQPPEGQKKNDFGVSASVGWSF